MKVVGIIAEYNPFHKGHAYQIRYAKERLGADYVIVAMSGPFTQRGTPALFDKYSRAGHAACLRCRPGLGTSGRLCDRQCPIFATGGVALCKMQGWWIPSYSAANVLIFAALKILQTGYLKNPLPIRRSCARLCRRDPPMPLPAQKP